ncbi:MAG: transporter, partial [Glaciihabitans sp.]|nr:transporter [Glaciihabitans sp.]
MRSRKPAHTAASIVVAALTFFVVAACASPGNPAGSGSETSTSTTSTSDASATDASTNDASTSDASTSDASTGNDGSLSGHGAIADAAEVPEPPLGIASVSAGGQLALLDLVTGEDTAVDELGAVSAVDSNGRYLFATPASGDGVLIADSGAWTVPHGDHFHYYSAAPRVVGTVKGDGPAVVSSATSRTAIWFGDSGTGIVLDGDDLGAGNITEVGRVSTTPHDGVLVPFGDVLLGSVADGEGDASAVQVYNVDGSERSGAPAACANLSGTITTNV